MPPSTTAPTPPDLRRFRHLGQAASRVAMAALVQAHNLLGLATGRHLRDARAQEEPLRNLQARLEEAELKAQLAWEALQIVLARLAKIPERHRPYYSPAQRFRIVEIKRLLGWTREEAAGTFLVCQNTISNWEAAVDPEAGTIGSTVKPVPPVVRFSDDAPSGDRSTSSPISERSSRARSGRVSPAEVFLSLEPACQHTRPAPRGQPGAGDRRVPFRIEMLSPTERLFPILVPSAA